jgi:hypothetical protein
MDLKALIRDNLIPTNDKEFDSLSLLDPFNRYAEIDLSINDYINYQTCLLFSGPPRLLDVIKNREMVKPVGLCINFFLQSEKKYVVWDELNSDEERHIPGKTRISMQLGRIMTNHNSLLYALYRWLTVTLLTKEKQQDSNLGLGQLLPFINYPGFATRQANSSYPPDSDKAFAHNRSNRHYHNLHSELFHMPFGFLVVKLDGFLNLVDAIYVENCKVRVNNFSIQDAPLIVENASILCSKVRPANGLTLKTITQSEFNLIPSENAQGISNSNINVPGAFGPGF